MTISHQVIGKQLFMSLPYAMKDAFRTLFKTAKWSPERKAFVAASTPQNLKKWERFVEASGDISKILEQKDQEEATVRELEHLTNEMTRAREKIKHEIERAQDRTRELRKEAEEAKAQAIALRPAHDEAKEKLNKVLEENKRAKEERDAVIAPVVKLYEEHRLESMLKEFESAARCGYRGKNRLLEAFGALTRLIYDLNEIGFHVPALKKLHSASIHRPDNILDGVTLARITMYSGIEKV